MTQDKRINALMFEAADELHGRYRELRRSSMDRFRGGVTLVFQTERQRTEAEQSGLTDEIAAAFRSIVARKGLDASEHLRIIHWADYDAIQRAGGEYNFYK
ncbi:MAG: hypothetical protein IPM16_20500 [Chloroflexi bacterium]|nr:hypothetical protein [Chloroflexota bacterium]